MIVFFLCGAFLRPHRRCKVSLRGREEIGLIRADFIHLTAGEPDDDTEDKTGNDRDGEDDDCYSDGCDLSDDDGHKDCSHPSSDTVKVVDTHDIKDSELLAEHRLEVGEAECGDDTCDDTDEECSPRSDRKEGCSDCDRTAEHCVGVGEGIDLLLADHAYCVCADDGSCTGHEAGGDTLVDGGLVAEKRGDEGRPENPKEHTGKPDEGDTVGGDLHRLIECPLLLDSETNSEAEVSGAKVNEDGSSGVGGKVSANLNVSDNPLNKSVCDCESETDEHVLPHLTGSEEHTDRDDQGDGADDCPDEKGEVPCSVEVQVLDSDVYDHADHGGEEGCKADSPLEFLDEQHQEGDEHKHEPNVDTFGKLVAFDYCTVTERGGTEYFRNLDGISSEVDHKGSGDNDEDKNAPNPYFLHCVNSVTSCELYCVTGGGDKGRECLSSHSSRHFRYSRKHPDALPFGPI